MPLQLTSRIEAKVEEIMANGRFADAEDVIEEALRLLDEHERLQRLRASLIEAEQQTARGEVYEWTPELSEQIWREAEEMARQGMKPDPDVCPQVAPRDHRASTGGHPKHSTLFPTELGT